MPARSGSVWDNGAWLPSGDPGQAKLKPGRPAFTCLLGPFTSLPLCSHSSLGTPCSSPSRALTWSAWKLGCSGTLNRGGAGIRLGVESWAWVCRAPSRLRPSHRRPRGMVSGLRRLALPTAAEGGGECGGCLGNPIYGPPDSWPIPGRSDSYFAKSRKGEAIASTPAETPGKVSAPFPAGQDCARPGQNAPGRRPEGTLPRTLHAQGLPPLSLCPFPSFWLALYMVGGPRSGQAVISDFQEPLLSPSPGWVCVVRPPSHIRGTQTIAHPGSLCAVAWFSEGTGKGGAAESEHF